MISALLICAYVLAALWLIMIFNGMKVFSGNHQKEKVPVSIIICARNEGRYLERCLQSLIRQNYPKHLMEVLLVNDASTDQTAEIAQRVLSESGLAFTVIHNEKHLGKKESIRKAISVAGHEWLVTRDADTYSTSENWLSTLMTYALTENKQFVIAPVMLESTTPLISTIQAAEASVLMMLTAVTAAVKRPFLCSGANMAFTRMVFEKAGAYTSHLHVKSGDDVLFLEDVKRISSDDIGYVHHPDALIYTYAEQKPEQLFNQRIRWASKVFVNTNLLNLRLAAFITAVNVCFIFNLLRLLMDAELNALIFVLLKLLIDNLLVFLTTRFSKEPFSLLRYLLTGLFYPFYVVVIAFGSLLVNPRWK
jgi:biofilm PGA synthesis N-glycosyltransferase PgaC